MDLLESAKRFVSRKQPTYAVETVGPIKPSVSSDLLAPAYIAPKPSLTYQQGSMRFWADEFQESIKFAQAAVCRETLADDIMREIGAFGGMWMKHSAPTSVAVAYHQMALSREALVLPKKSVYSTIVKNLAMGIKKHLTPDMYWVDVEGHEDPQRNLYFLRATLSLIGRLPCFPKPQSHLPSPKP